MDDYDPRRLQAFLDKKIKFSPEELKALASVEPSLSEEDLQDYAAAGDAVDANGVAWGQDRPPRSSITPR